MTHSSSKTPIELLPINEVAARFGIKASALRYYEEIGLLEPIVRRSGRRYYGLFELRRLALIQMLQEIASMSLKEIVTIIHAGSEDRTARAALEERISILEHQIKSAQLATRYLNHRLSCSRENPFDECPVLARELLDRMRDAGIVVPENGDAHLLAQEIRPDAKAALEAGSHRRRAGRPRQSYDCR